MNIRRFLKTSTCTAAALVAAATTANAQIVAFDVNNNQAGCETGTSFLASNVSNQQLCRGPGITATSAANGYSGSGWTEASEAAAVSVGDYFSAKIDVSASFNADLTNIVAVFRRSGTGPSSVAVRSSVDSFATTIATGTVTGTSDNTVTFDFADIIGATGTVEFRIYAWGSTNVAGTFRLTDSTVGTPSLTINGTVQGGGGGDPTGACCFLNGTCNVLTAAACATGSGTYAGNDVTCIAANCPPAAMGACCVLGICQGVFTESDCLTFSGVWGGANSDCNTFACPAPEGTCCISGVCTITTQASCSGTWTVGGACTASTCPAIGACCIGTTCTVTEYTGCTGIWLGKGVLCEASTCIRPALAPSVIAVHDFDLARDGGQPILTRVSDGTPLAAPIPGQMFDIGQRYRSTVESLPFGVLDDTTSIFAGDVTGIIRESKVDAWFGAVNMYAELAGDANPDTDPAQLGEDEVQASWTFNIAGRSNLSVAIDMAAMGDFEAIDCSAAPGCVVDRYTFAVSIDGAPFSDLFVVLADQSVNQSYTLASGTMFTLEDPLKVDGTTVLINDFANFSKNVTGTGTTLTLRLRAQSDGNTEAFAFDNIVVRGDIGAITGGCCTAGNCSVATQSLCELGGGTYLGNGVACNAGNCSSAPTPCELADFNDVDGVTADDIFAFLDAWFAQNGVCMSPTVCSADINGVDDVTADDIFAFLDLWFTFNGQTCP